MLHGHCLGLVRAQSMDLVNDPRFFTHNVVEKRLTALGAMAVVSSLMVATVVGQLFKLKKEMNLSTMSGWFQLSGFAVMSLILFLCLVSTIVIIHQMLFVYRLMTSGATGLETAASFYLNKNIAVWRHFAMKTLGWSLPLFLISIGLMLFVMWDAGGKKK